MSAHGWEMPSHTAKPDMPTSPITVASRVQTMYTPSAIISGNVLAVPMLASGDRRHFQNRWLPLHFQTPCVVAETLHSGCRATLATARRYHSWICRADWSPDGKARESLRRRTAPRSGSRRCQAASTSSKLNQIIGIRVLS
jgi:hypothetical protein